MPRVCVFAKNAPVPRKACFCRELPKHFHITLARAKQRVSTGEVRRIRKGVYKVTRSLRERVDWQPKRSGRNGPLVMQMIQ